MAINYTLFQFPSLPAIFCAFHKKSASCEGLGNISFLTGDSPEIVRRNRQELFEALEPLGLREVAECRQVHGDNLIKMQNGSTPENLQVADGLMTDRKGLGLLIKTADCQAILICDKPGAHIMAIHAGWRGNRINFPATAINVFCEAYKLQPAELMAVRGPSLGPACSEFVNFEREWGEEFTNWFDQKTNCMNLWQLTRDQLINAGIPTENIYGIDICTKLNSHDYFSYRQDKNCGRQASLIWIQ